MSPDRLSPLDASFLHIEDHVSHMHIASVAIFEGPPPPFGDIVAMVDAKLDLVPRYRQKVRFVPFELGRPVWVDDPHFNIEYHLRHTALPVPGRRERAAQAGRPRHGAAARPLQAAVGDLGGRGPRGRPLGHAGQDAPRAGRRRLGHRPAGRDHGPQPRRRAAGAVGVDAAARALQPPADGGRAGEHRAVALRAGAGGAGPDPGPAQNGGLRARGGRRPVLPRRAGAPDPALQPQRSARPPSALRLGHHVGRGHQAGAQGAGRHLQRRGAGQHHQRVPRAAARHATRTSSASCARWCPSRSGRATRRARPSATAPTRTRSRPCSPSCRSTSTTPRCACTSSPSR